MALKYVIGCGKNPSGDNRTKLSPTPTLHHGLMALSWLLAGVSFAYWQPECLAVPSFARQMDMQCAACHTEFPTLTAMGRQFKLSGYTMSTDQSDLPPIAIMLMPSFTHTQAGQEGGAAPGFGNNNNFAVTQASIFYAGRLFGPYASKLFGANAATVLNKIGIFSQTTYDGVGKTWSWDNTEIRYADVGTIAGQGATYGVYVNNNPTFQDPWNSTPAWTFPYSGSGLAPSPAAGTLIEGTLAQQVAGLGAYTMVADRLYLDFGAYCTLGSRVQKSLGVDPTGETQIAGIAPYWRVAFERPAGPGLWEFGTFGMAADTYPGRDASAGKDRIADFGLDSEYQASIGRHDMTALLSGVYERQTWNASQALGLTANASGVLRTFKATIGDLYDKTYGLTVQYFVITGDKDPVLYPDSVDGSPNSNGYILQASYLPFNKGTGPAFWPRSTIKFSLQYVIYNRFDGSTTSPDGSSPSAKDNNTLYLQSWIVF
ncbi:MAG: cytochrome C [Lacunisphaera sp.]